MGKKQKNVSYCTQSKFTTNNANFRSFVRETLESGELKKDDPDLFLNHIALINHVPGMYVLASCFTFLPPSEVPVGMSNRVMFRVSLRVSTVLNFVPVLDQI